MKKAAAVLKNLLFPRRCPYCGQVVGFAPACGCAPRVEACRLCGPAALLDGEGRRLAFLDGGAACYAYTGPIREGIRRLKFAGRVGAGRALWARDGGQADGPFAGRAL